MVKPHRTLFFLCIVFGLLTSVIWFFPGGFNLGGLKIKLPERTDFWGILGQSGVNMDEYFDIYARKPVEDPLEKEQARQRKMEAARRFQYPDGDSTILAVLLKKIAEKSKSGRVRVLHFGDSQIERHRISGYLNARFQQKYGGYGPGWIPVTEVIPTPYVLQSASDNWLRFTVFGPPRSQGHRNYGLLGSFCRFAPQSEVPSSSEIESTQKELLEAWFELRPSTRQGSRNSRFTHMKLGYGNLNDTLHYQLWSSEMLIDEGVWFPEKNVMLPSWHLPTPTDKIRMSFKGSVSPDFYGVSLETDQGVFVDNIPMRGSSGTEFVKMNLDIHKAMVDEDEVALVIFQFGGNQVPHIMDISMIKEYGKYIHSQLLLLKRTFQDATILVIGPSDMSTKVGTLYKTYPILPDLNAEIKRVAFQNKCMYFDLFEAMGGAESMPEWVSSDPALAVSDYIHFTDKGAQWVATWLADAFFSPSDSTAIKTKK